MRKLFKYLSVLGWTVVTVLCVKTAAEGGDIPNGVAIMSSLMCFLFAMALLVSEYTGGDSE